MCNPRQIKLCEKQDCQQCYEKSFASHEKNLFWSIKNDKLPRDVFKSARDKYWFNCNNCSHDFEKTLDSISSKNSWCPYCKNKTEVKLYQWLKDFFEYEIIPQSKYEWCKNPLTNRYLPFDFSIKELKLIIELDGDQHFKQISNWASHDNTRKKDVYKMSQALKNGYNIIRLLQTDVLNDLNNWDVELKKVIRKYDEPEIITICNGTEYEIHMSELTILDTIELDSNDDSDSEDS